MIGVVMVDNKEFGKIVPTKLTQEQIEKIDDLRKEIENDIELELFPSLGNWREHHYMGGNKGVNKDDYLKKMNKHEEIVVVQKFINTLVEIGFLEGKTLKENGIYTKETFENVRNLQMRINEVLAKNKEGVFVPPSAQEKKTVPSVLKKILSENKELRGSLLNAVSGKTYETKFGKYTYKVRMGVSTEKGRVGVIDVFDENEQQLKKISFSVDNKGKISINGVKLYQILVDGYVGVETLRALGLVAETLLKGKEKEEEAKEAVKPVPTPTEKVVKIGLSFTKYLKDVEWENVKAMLNNTVNATDYEKNEKKINKINKVLWGLSYEQEKALRDNPPKIKVEGEEFSATWQGMMIAKNIYGISYGEFLDAWWDFLKKDERTKDLAKAVEKGENIEVKNKQLFIIVGESPNSRIGGSGIGVDATEIGKIFKQIKDNINATAPEESVMRNFVIDKINNMQKEVEERLLTIAREVSKKGGNKEELIERLNEDKKLCDQIYQLYSLMGNMVGSQNTLTMPAFDTKFTDEKELTKSLKEYLENAIKKDERIVNEINRCLFSGIERFFGAGYKRDEALRMAEKIISRYGELNNGRWYLRLEDMDPEMRVFMNGYELNKIYSGKQEKIPMRIS